MTSAATGVKKVQQQHENIVDSLIGKTFSRTNSASGASGGQTLQKYDIGCTLGQGSYAIVKLAVDQTTKQKVAIKTYDKFKLLDPQ